MLSTNIHVSELFQPGLLAGPDNPVQLPFVDSETHKHVAFWLIFTKLKKVWLDRSLPLPLLVNTICRCISSAAF